MENIGIHLKKQWFVESRKGNIKESYFFEKKLGSGGYGQVYLAFNKITGEKVAVKAIQKNRVQDYDSFLNEINILRNMDHPNIIKLYETWETDRICFLIQELCEGGELFFYITSKKFLTEAQAARIMKQVFSAINYCHANNICHRYSYNKIIQRDLKHENFLLKNKNDDSHIKLIDFGLAKELSENELMNTPNGTPYYIAPEVLRGKYNSSCDNWSLGVILYIMMCGRPPFGGKSNNEILSNVAKGVYHFEYEPFKKASSESKDLISKLLIKDPNLRITAEKAYHHPWIQHQKETDDVEPVVDMSVIANMKEYIDAQNFKKTALTFMASRIPEEEIEKLRETFIRLDRNGDGRITSDELKEGLSKVQTKDLEAPDVELFVKVLDSNQNGYLDYTEFIAGCLQSYVYLKEANLKRAFNYFDKDGSGKITAKEIKEVLCSEDLLITEEEISKMINEADVNKDGEIDYKEFLTLMQNESPLMK